MNKTATSLLVAAAISTIATSANAEEINYTVKPEDTYTSISQMVYGTKEYRANIAMYLNELVLKPGEIIALPVDIVTASKKVFEKKFTFKDVKKNMTTNSQEFIVKKAYHKKEARSSHSKIHKLVRQ